MQAVKQPQQQDHQEQHQLQPTEQCPPLHEQSVLELTSPPALTLSWVTVPSMPGLLQSISRPVRGQGAVPVGPAHPAQHGHAFKQQQQQLVQRMAEIPTARNWATASCHAAVLKV